MSAPKPTTPTLDSAIDVVWDFPERLGPVLTKELRQGLRSGFFAVPFAIIPALLGLQVLWALLEDNPASARSIVNTCYWLAISIPVLAITPMRALGAIRSEREAQTLELLQLTPLTAWKIVFAKWSSLCVQALLWVVGLLPFFALRHYFGGVNLTEDLVALLWILLTGASFTAIAIVASTLPRVLFWLFVAGFAFVGISSTFGLMGMLFASRGLSSVFGFGSGTGAHAGMWIISACISLHLIFIALTFAASRIAPPAENYQGRLRIASLGLFVWWGAAALWLRSTMGDEVHMFMVWAAAALVLLTLIKAASEAKPLAVHVRPWARFGTPGLLLARLFLPGWPSTVLFFSVATAIVSILLFVFVEHKPAILVACALTWSSVLFARGVQCLFNLRGELPALHIALFALGPIAAAFLSLFKSVLGDAIIVPAAALPNALIVLVATDVIRLPAAETVVGLIAGAWVVGLSFVFVLRSRGHRAEFKRIVATLRP